MSNSTNNQHAPAVHRPALDCPAAGDAGARRTASTIASSEPTRPAHWDAKHRVFVIVAEFPDYVRGAIFEQPDGTRVAVLADHLSAEQQEAHLRDLIGYVGQSSAGAR